MRDQHFLDLSEAPENFFSTPLLYRRKPVNDLHQMLRYVTEKQWRKVEQNESYPRRFAHVYGPPGSGKSSASWCWAHHARNKQGCTFAYVRCDLQSCYITKPDGTTIVVPPAELETNLLQTETDGDFARVICIFDQSLNKNIDPFIPVIVRLIKAGVGVILVSSEGVRLNQGTFAGLISVDHRFPGWTLEEYSAAINHQPFFDAIKNTAFGEQAVYANRDLLLEEKFLFAGHSARYMFAKSTKEVHTQIAKDVSAVDPSLIHLQNALRSPSAVGTINSLMSWLFTDGNGVAPEEYEPLIISGAWANEDTRGDNFGRRDGMSTLNCFVSEYAGQKWVESTPASSAELKFLGLSLREMSVVGYGFQQRFYEVTRDAFMHRRTLSVSVGCVVESWAINEFDALDPEILLNQAEDARAGRFFWCVGKTAAYDAVLIYANGRIRFVQVTAGKEHSFKIYAVDGLLRELERRGIVFTHVDFVVVRPLPDTANFKLKAPVGSLQRWFDFTGTKWQSGGNCRNQVRHGKVDWS